MKMQTTFLFLCFFLILFSQDPPDTLWTIRLGDPETNKSAKSVRQTSEGGFIVTGSSISDTTGYSDFWLVKLTDNGTVEWERTFGGIYTEEAYCVKQTSDNGYIVVGHTTSFGAGSYDIWLVKTDAYGFIEWEQTFGGFTWEFGRSVIQTNDEGYIITGSTASYGAGDYDIWIIRTDENGNMLWERTFGGDAADYGHCIVQSNDDNIVVCGFTYSVNNGTSDAMVIKLDNSGNEIWTQQYGMDNWDYAFSIDQTNDNGYILAGFTEIYNQISDQAIFWKLDENGAVEWSQQYGGVYNERASSIQQTLDNGYIFCGKTSSFGSGGYDLWVFKADENGYHEWSYTFGGSENDQAGDIVQTFDGGYIVVGETLSFNGNSTEAWVIRLGNGVPSDDEYIEHNDMQLDIFPNPHITSSSRSSSVVILYSTENSRRQNISIYNIRGRLIREFSDPGGSGIITWDKTDNNGKIVNNGIYLCRFENGRKEIFRKLTIMK